MPGVPKENVKVSLENNRISISGVKPRLFDEKDASLAVEISEGSWGNFSRSIPLPKDCDKDTVTATYENGILTLNIRKTEAMPSKNIKIQ